VYIGRADKQMQGSRGRQEGRRFGGYKISSARHVLIVIHIISQTLIALKGASASRS
jgi:hypothetical protein